VGNIVADLLARYAPLGPVKGCELLVAHVDRDLEGVGERDVTILEIT
jgi:hypothetical protein